MAIPCKMRGSDGKITFCVQTLPNFVIPFIMFTDVKFL